MLSDQDTSRATLCNEEKLKDFSDIELGQPDRTLPSNPSSRYRRCVLALGAIVILIAALYFIAPSIGLKTLIDQCGTNAEEARALGCVFEVTGFSWVPKECYDPETEAKFLEHITSNNIQLYRDVNYTQIVPMEEVRQGNGEGLFVYQEYHVAHCLFLLEKMHKALAAGKPLDGYTMPFHHTEHCVKQSLLPPGARKFDRQASVIKWPYCGRPGGYNVDWHKKDEWIDY